MKFNDLLSQISSDDVKFVLETDLPPNDFLQLINNFDNSKFELVEKKFLFKSSILKLFVRKIFFNRFFIINSNFLFNLYYKLNKMYFFSEEKNCENIFLILKKKWEY